MKTAVEWYSDRLLEILGESVNDFTKEQIIANHYAFEKAKWMEKVQIKNAYKDGYTKCHYYMIDFSTKVKLNLNDEQYYNKTYKNTNE